jgi:hypothetical protein
MALDFSGVIDSERDRFEVVGPQFESEATSAKVIGHSFSGGTSGTIYTVPAGKTLFITKMIANNKSTGGTGENWGISVGGQQIWSEFLARQTIRQLDFPSPIPVLAGETVTASAGDLSNTMSIIGWEQ